MVPRAALRMRRLSNRGHSVIVDKLTCCIRPTVCVILRHPSIRMAIQRSINNRNRYPTSKGNPMHMTSLAALVVAAVATCSPVLAQDWLGSHRNTILEHNPGDHVLQRQQQGVRMAQSAGEITRLPTMADRQAAWSHNKVEYRQRLLRDGPAAADRWLEQLAAGGVKASQADPTVRQSGTPSKTVRSSKKSLKSCKRIRYVTRPRPVFGGGMVLSRVAVCAD